MSDLHKRLTVRRWSDYVIAVYGPDGRVVEVHDCRWHGGEKCSLTTTKAKHTGGGE